MRAIKREKRRLYRQSIRQHCKVRAAQLGGIFLFLFWLYGVVWIVRHA